MSRNDASGDADWIDPDAAATCEMARCSRDRLGVPLTTGDGRARDEPHGGRGDGHGDVPAPEHDAANAAGRRGTARGRRARWPRSRAGSTAPSRRRSCGSSAASSTASIRRSTVACSGRRSSTRICSSPGALTGGVRGHHRPHVAVDDRRGRDPVQGGRRGDAGQRPHATGRRRCHGADGRVRRRWPRPCRRCHRRPAAGRRSSASSLPRRSASPRSSSADRHRIRARRGATATVPATGRHPCAREAEGPTSHDMVALVRRLSGTSGSATAARSIRSRPGSCRSSSARPPGSSSSTSARRSATARRSASEPSSTTDDLEGELTPVDGSGADSRARSRRPSPAFRGDDPAAAARVQRDQSGRPTCLRHGARRRDAGPRPAERHDPRARR